MFLLLIIQWGSNDWLCVWNLLQSVVVWRWIKLLSGLIKMTPGCRQREMINMWQNMSCPLSLYVCLSHHVSVVTLVLYLTCTPTCCLSLSLTHTWHKRGRRETTSRMEVKLLTFRSTAAAQFTCVLFCVSLCVFCLIWIHVEFSEMKLPNTHQLNSDIINII